MSAQGRIPVAVLGATGAVGQRFLALLDRHPWFRATVVSASERSVGRTYREAVRWSQTTPIPDGAAGLEVRPAEPDAADGVALVFSALGGDVAGPIEEAFARAGHLVVSNARSHRMDPSVPLLVPEVNPDHLDLLDRQPYEEGGIVTNPNCSTIGLVLTLKPLLDRFGVGEVRVTTLQALSGAGLPGVPALDLTDNVVPFIRGEEEKLEREPPKILGWIEDGAVRPAQVAVSAHCTRVPVTDGHLECVSVTLGRSVSAREVRAAWEGWRSVPQRRALPGAPSRPLHYLDDERAPQPRLHRDLEQGMAVSIGRLRPDPLGGFRFACLSHNTVRGAAGGAILCAELALVRGRVPGAAAPTARAGRTVGVP